MKIKRLDIVLKQPTKEDYEKERKKYIAEYTEYQPGHSAGFWGGWIDGRNVHKPDVGSAKWDSLYPRGFFDWGSFKGESLSSYGQMEVVEKLNEIIELLNRNVVNSGGGTSSGGGGQNIPRGGTSKANGR